MKIPWEIVAKAARRAAPVFAQEEWVYSILNTPAATYQPDVVDLAGVIHHLTSHLGEKFCHASSSGRFHANKSDDGVVTVFLELVTFHASGTAES